MVYHKTWLQTATPAIAEGAQGRTLPEGDLAWKHLSIKGQHMVLATIYFDHSTGLAGNNLDKFRRAASLTDEGRRMIILAGDYNMEPDEWDQEILDAVGLTIITVGSEKTCKTSKASKQNDYLLVSTSLVPFIEDLAIVPDVVWQPHVAIAFSINRRPGKVYHQAIDKPATLPYVKEANGKVLPWCIDDRAWLSKLDDMKDAATKAIDATRDDDTGIWQHASSLGATDPVRTFSIKYAQWSMATEKAIIDTNPEAKKSSDQLGRGLPPSYKWETIADRSGSLPIEHLIWSQPQPVARAGSDLFSTLWVTISGALRSIASARRLGNNGNVAECAHTLRTIRLHSKFSDYLLDAEKSPLCPLPDKAQTQRRSLEVHPLCTVLPHRR